MKQQAFKLITNDNIKESNIGKPALELKTNHELIRREDLLNGKVATKDIDLQDIKNLTAGATRMNEEIQELIDLQKLHDVLGKIEGILDEVKRNGETELERKRRERNS